MRKLLFCTMFIVAFATTHTRAATPEIPTYALLSLIGDKLDIVIASQLTGSRTDQSRREAPLAIEDPVFDNIAATSAGEAVRKVIPRAELAILNSRSPVLFEKQRVLFEEKSGSIAIPEAIRTALQNEKATHLILISKHRDFAQVQFSNATDGAGMLEGLGFYLDGATDAYSGDSGGAGRGYIAPFFYAKITLVDVQTSKVIKKQTITAWTTISSARALENLASPWAALSSAEKVSAINRLIQREIARVVPQLLKAD